MREGLWFFKCDLKFHDKRKCWRLTFYFTSEKTNISNFLDLVLGFERKKKKSFERRWLKRKINEFLTIFEWELLYIIIKE